MTTSDPLAEVRQQLARLDQAIVNNANTEMKLRDVGRRLRRLEDKLDELEARITTPKGWDKV